MDLHPETPIDAAQAEAMARALFAIAHSDGLHEREAALVASFFDDLGGGAHALAELERREPITGTELAAVLGDPGHRRLFLKTALLLAWADGKVSEAEQKLIGEYAAALEVSAEELGHLDEGVKEYLLAHLAHLQNVDATRAVAQKLEL